MSNFNEQMPEWNKAGSEPPQAKRNDGWTTGDKPPAGWLNWLFNRIYKCIIEIRTLVDSHLSTKATTGAEGHVRIGSNINVSDGLISVNDASTEQKGVIQLYDGVDSTDATKAATANILKEVNDKASNPHNNLPDYSIPSVKFKQASDADKIKLANLAAEVIAAITGTSPVGLIPADGSVTNASVAANTLQESRMANDMKKGLAGGIAKHDDLLQLIQDLYDAGIGFDEFPLNLNTGEGTSTPAWWGQRTEGDAAPGVRIVTDTDSPVRTHLAKKRQIYRTYNDGSGTNFLGSEVLPSLVSRPSKICWGFWVKDSDVNAIFSSTNKMVYWLYQDAGSSYIELLFDIKDVITSADRTVAVTNSIPGAGLITSYNAEAKCMHKDSGYSYVRVTLYDIVWAASFSTENVKWYWILNNPVKPAMVGKEINLTNLTLLYNQDILSGYYIYADGGVVSQYPPINWLQKQIDNISDILDTDLVDVLAAVDILETYVTSLQESKNLDNIIAQVRQLPTNKNWGEGTTSPRYLATVAESSTTQGIRLVADNDSPMTGNLAYKRQVFRTTAPGAVNFTNYYLPDLSAKPSNICFGYWVKDTDVNTIFSSSRLMEYWLFQGGKYIVFTFDLKALIAAAIGGTVPVNKTVPGAGLIDSYDVEAKCMHKDGGYTYVRINVKSIVWNAAFTNYSLIFWYHIFSNVKTQLVGAEINISNLTLLIGDVIDSGYYVYGDGVSVEQIPTITTYQYQIDQNRADIQTLETDVVSLEDDVDTLSTAVNDLQNKYGIKLTIDSSQVSKDVAIRTAFNATYDLVQYMQTFKNDGRNNVVNPLGGTLIPVASASPYNAGVDLSVLGDDACPANFTGYLGANHGYDRCRKITKANHGKTYADISSEWLDGAGKKWYILKIIDVNTFWILGENLAVDEFYDCVSAFTGTTMTHSTGAVNTTQLTGITIENDQLVPIVANLSKKVMINGTTEVSANDTYLAKTVDIVEWYDIINPSTIVPYLIANKPVGGYTQNPALNVGSSVCTISNIYRFFSDGTMVIINDFTNLIRINLGYFGITQSQLPAANPLGGGLFKYIPKALPVTVGSNTYEFRIPRNMSLAIADSVNLTNTYWEDANSPPDRDVNLYRDGSGVNKAGFAIGYLPVAYGASALRKTSVTNAWNIYTSKKSYPHYVDSALGNPLDANTAMQGIAYRKFFDMTGAPTARTAFYLIPSGDKTYMYVDYHNTVDDRITMPKELVGKSFTVVEKSSNVTVFGSIVTDKLRVKVATADPLYGYAVLLIS